MTFFKLARISTNHVMHTKHRITQLQIETTLAVLGDHRRSPTELELEIAVLRFVYSLYPVTRHLHSNWRLRCARSAY